MTLWHSWYSLKTAYFANIQQIKPRVPECHSAMTKIFDDADSSLRGRTKRVFGYGIGAVTTKEQPRKNERTTNGR